MMSNGQEKNHSTGIGTITISRITRVTPMSSWGWWKCHGFILVGTKGTSLSLSVRIQSNVDIQ